MTAIIRIVAAVATDAAGHVLLVRKRGTTAFMQPGGKLEAGETPTEALSRELLEELGCTIEPQAEHLGMFSAPAANEPGSTVEADLYRVKLIGSPRPLQEIVELRWVDPCDLDGIVLAPLSRDHVLPALRGADPAGRELEQNGSIASTSL